MKKWEAPTLVTLSVEETKGNAFPGTRPDLNYHSGHTNYNNGNPTDS